MQVRAQVLRDLQAAAGTDAGWGFAIMTDKDPAETGAQGDKPDTWHDDDLKRAIALAQEAGLARYRVEIAPDGTICIVVGGPDDERTDD